MRFALRAIAAQPGGYLTAVLHDVSLAFHWTTPGHPSALMTRRYEVAYATRHWISPNYAPVPGHTVASDEAAYGGATATRAVAPFAGWMRAYQRAAYLPGTLLAGVLAAGLGGILLSCRAARRRNGVPRSSPPLRAARRRDGPWGGPALYPWLAALTALVAPVMTADYSQRYVLIAVPLACLAAPLAFTRPESHDHVNLFVTMMEKLT